jgi:hypothetical protein
MLGCGARNEGGCESRRQEQACVHPDDGLKIVRAYELPDHQGTRQERRRCRAAYRPERRSHAERAVQGNVKQDIGNRRTRAQSLWLLPFRTPMPAVPAVQRRHDVQRSCTGKRCAVARALLDSHSPSFLARLRFQRSAAHGTVGAWIQGAAMTTYMVGLKLQMRNKVISIEAEDALVAALKIKLENPEALITYVRKSNQRGDRRHPHEALQAKPTG